MIQHLFGGDYALFITWLIGSILFCVIGSVSAIAFIYDTGRRSSVLVPLAAAGSFLIPSALMILFAIIKIVFMSIANFLFYHV